MTDDDDDDADDADDGKRPATEVPASSAAAVSALSAPSEAVAELQARAADAAAEAQEEVERQRVDDDEKRAKEGAAKEDARASEARAPTSYWRSSRFFITAFVGLGAGALVGGWAFEEGALTGWLRPLAIGFATLWTLVIAQGAIDGATWRKRLPFALDSFDHIGGGHVFDDNRAPVVKLDIKIVFDAAPNGRARKEAREAMRRTAEILVGRVNKMRMKDEDYKEDAKGAWKTTADGCVGEGGRWLYTSRVIERWLRDDVALLAKAHPVKRVVVHANFTGASKWMSSS